MVDLARLRVDVGGRTLLDRRWLLLLVPTSLVTSLLSRGVVDGPSLFGWTLANVVAFVACWGWVTLSDRTVFRRRATRPVPIPAVVAFGATLGALKGAMTDLAGRMLGLGPISLAETAWRSVGTAALGAVAVPAVAALQGAVERYRTEHALLVAQLLQHITVERDEPSDEDAQRASDLRRFATEAQRALAASPPGEAAATILRLVDDRLRPYTHELWARSDAPHRELDLRSVLRIAVRRNPLPYVPIVVAYVLSVLPVSIELAGPGRGTLRALIAGATLLGVLALARALRPPAAWSAAAGLHLALTVAVATIIQILQWDHLFGGLPRPSTLGLWVSVAIWLTLLLVVAGAVTVALRTRAALRSEVLRVVGPEALRAVAMRDHDRLAAQRVATRLHADLQGQLIAVARRIELLGDDPSARAAELATIDRLLRDLPHLSDSMASDPAPLGEQLRDLEDRWRGFVELHVLCAPEVLGVAVPLQERATQVVSEAVVNAARHGLATSVAAEIRVDASGLEVRVVDDGIGPRDGAPGLGSTFFTANSGGDWSLVAGVDGGSVLRVRLMG
jgi:signal transduction histidine kinase